MAILKSANLGWVILLVCIAYISKGEGFKQEIWLQDEVARGLHLTAQDSNLTRYDFFLKTVTHYCGSGYWMPFTSTDFQDPTPNFYYMGSVNSYAVCADVNATSFKSIRFFGAPNTDTDAISLYRGSNFNEEEILVTQEGAYTDITHEILSLAVTGNSTWTLFEEGNLEGKSVCYGGPRNPGWFFNYDRVTSLNITNVGSVFKGCNLEEIQAYKAHNLV